MNIVDLHCDTISCRVAESDGKILLRENNGSLDLVRMKKGGSLMQCFAIFIPWPGCGSNKTQYSHYEFFNFAYDLYRREIDANKDMIDYALTYDDVMKNQAAGKMSALLTIEDGVPLDGKIERVDEFFEKGVRLITLTWNHENSLGYPNATDPGLGLKPFGIEALRRMNELGIIADVAHLSDAGFYDVYKYSTKPFVASHSNVRALCPVLRNLTDDMLHKLADKGGVVGLNFASDFLVKNSKFTYIYDLVQHAKYIRDKAGVEAIAFGSDFDGIGNELEFTDCAGFPMIEREFEKVFTPREMDLITHENALRVLRDCEQGLRMKS